MYYPDGGFGGVVDAVANLARDLGVTIETGVEVSEIARGQEGFFVAAGDSIRRADAVVSDADYAHTELELLPERDRQYSRNYWETREYGPSAFISYLGIDRELPELEHHNVIMPPEWDDHFRHIYEERTWSTDPVYYVCNATRTDPSIAPEGQSALMISTATPAGSDDATEKRDRYRGQLLADLAETTGVDVRGDIVYEQTRTVSDFASQYNAWRGSLGLAQSLRQTGPLRPGHRSRTVDRLYYAGSATNPGVGAPVCLLSGKHAAACVQEDLGQA